MLRRSKFTAGLFLLAICLSCAPTEATVVAEPAATEEQAQSSTEDISIAVKNFESAVLAGDFSNIKKMLYSNNFTFKQNGEIYQHIRCFICWTPDCEIQNVGVKKHPKGRTFFILLSYRR